MKKITVPERMNDMNFSELDRLLERVSPSVLPFCDLHVTKDGKEIYQKSVGCSDIAQTKPFDAHDLVWIFSCTKIATCTAAMKLVEEGKLRLDAPVSDYLPAFRNVTVRQPDGTVAPAKNTMTVRHLFSMSAGLDYDLDAPAIREAVAHEGASTVDIVSALAKKPLHFEPGTNYLYSLAHDVLGGIVEVVSGKPLSQYLQENFFAPLGMQDTTFHPTQEQLARMATIYRHNKLDGTYAPAPDAQNQNKYTFTDNYDSGGAGIVSSGADYIKLITMLANEGKAPDGTPLLRPETVAQMSENQLCDAARTELMLKPRFLGYGFGLCGRVHMQPQMSLMPSPAGEFGWDGAAASYVLVDTKNHLAIFFATHIMRCEFAYSKVHTKLTELVYQALQNG